MIRVLWILAIQSALVVVSKRLPTGVDFSQAVERIGRDGKSRKCVEKTEFRQELKKDPVLKCVHQQVEQCHYTYKTVFIPSQEEVCDETFTKICSIQYNKVAYEEKYRHCYRPLVKDCGGPKDPPMTTTTTTPAPLPPCPPAASTPLAFVIDTTKSQENDKLSISGLSNTMLDMIMDESTSIPNFILTTFHDSAVLAPGNIPQYSERIEDNVELVLDTEDAEEFRDSVHAVEYGVNPGYDTKERAAQALLVTLEAIPRGGLILVFTDAGTKNLELEGDLLRLKNEKEAEIYVILTPKYQGQEGDSSWQLYAKLGQIFDIEDVPIDNLLSSVERFIVRQSFARSGEEPCRLVGAPRVKRQSPGENTVCQVYHESSCETRYVEKSPGKFVGDTRCEKVPVELCGRPQCSLVPGPEECHDKVTASVVDQPEEHCDLSPQKTCHHRTTLVPRLEPTHQCTLVPKEVCTIKYTNARVERVPFQTLWCQEDGDEALDDQLSSSFSSDDPVEAELEGYSYPVPSNPLDLPNPRDSFPTLIGLTGTSTGFGGPVRTPEVVSLTTSKVVSLDPTRLQAAVQAAVAEAVTQAVSKAETIQKVMRDDSGSDGTILEAPERSLLETVLTAVSQSVRSAVAKGVEKHSTARTPQTSTELEENINTAVQEAVGVSVTRILQEAGKADMMADTGVKADAEDMETDIKEAVVKAVRQAIRTALGNRRPSLPSLPASVVRSPQKPVRTLGVQAAPVPGSGGVSTPAVGGGPGSAQRFVGGSQTAVGDSSPPGGSTGSSFVGSVSAVGSSRPAVSAVGGSRPAVSAVGGSRPAVSSVGGSRPAVSAVGGSRPAVSSVGGSRPAVSGVGGSRPAVSAIGGSRPAVSAVGGSRPAVSAVGGSRPAVSAVGGSRPPVPASTWVSPTDDIVELDPSVIQAAIQAAIESAVRNAVAGATNLGEVTKDMGELTQTVEVAVGASVQDAMENNFENHNTVDTAQSSVNVESGIISAVNEAVATAVENALAVAGRPELMKENAVKAETDTIQDIVSQAVVAAVRQAVANAVGAGGEVPAVVQKPPPVVEAPVQAPPFRVPAGGLTPPAGGDSHQFGGQVGGATLQVIGQDPRLALEEPQEADLAPFAAPAPSSYLGAEFLLPQYGTNQPRR